MAAVRDFVKNPEKSKLESPKLRKTRKAHKKQTKKTVRTKSPVEGARHAFSVVYFFKLIKGRINKPLRPNKT